MKVRFGRYGVLVALCLGLALLASVPAANAEEKQCGEIIGAGSSLQNNAQQKVWITNFVSSKGWENFEGVAKEGYCFKQSSKSPVGVTYYSTSSGKGLGGWGSSTGKTEEEEVETGVFKFPTFVGTDVAPEGAATKAETQINNMDKAGGQGTGSKEGVVAVPVAQSAVTVMVALPVGCTAAVKTEEHPHISNATLQSVWYSNTTNFSKMIGGVKFTGGTKCEVDPTLYARSSASGTTAGFKRYFNKLKTLEPEKSKWAAATSTAAHAEEYLWPNTQPAKEGEFEKGKKVPLEKGSQLAKTVLENPGSIGYADLADAITAGFPQKNAIELHESKVTGSTEKYDVLFVEVGNSAYGTSNTSFASPQEGEGVNCAGAKYGEKLKVSGNEDWSQETPTNPEESSATNYPICTLTFDVAWHEYEKVKWPLKSEPKTTETYKEAQMKTVYGYLKYIVSKEGQSKLAGQHFGELPAGIRTIAANGLKEEPGSATGVIQWP